MNDEVFDLAVDIAKSQHLYKQQERVIGEEQRLNEAFSDFVEAVTNFIEAVRPYKPENECACCGRELVSYFERKRGGCNMCWGRFHRD